MGALKGSLVSKSDPDRDPAFETASLEGSGWRFREGFTLLQEVEARSLTLEYEVRPETAPFMESAILRVEVPWQETKRIHVASSAAALEAKVLFMFAAAWMGIWAVVVAWKLRTAGVNEMTASNRQR